MFGFLKKAVGNLVKKVKKGVEAKAVKEKRVKAKPKVKAGAKPVVKRVVKVEKPVVKPKGLFGSVVEKLKSVITEKEIREDDVRDILWSFQIELIQSNVAPDVAEKICKDIEKGLVGEKVRKSADVRKLILGSLRTSLSGILDNGEIDIEKRARAKKPLLIVFLGFNGSGKTTTIARLAYLLQKAGLKCVLAAGDSFRAASIEQLEVHGRRLGIKVIKQQYGSDSAAVIFDAMKYAEAHGTDIVLGDTAGRTHTNADLMAELEKIVRVNKPDLKLLVLDALTGSDIVQQSVLFDKAVSVDGIVFTKVDVDEKGGAIISAAHTLKKPILYQGLGQEYGDLKPFKEEEFLNNLLG